jgi:hypothetical protein
MSKNVRCERTGRLGRGAAAQSCPQKRTPVSSQPIFPPDSLKQDTRGQVKIGSPSAAKIRNARAPGPQGGVIPRKHTTVPIRERRWRKLRRAIPAVSISLPAQFARGAGVSEARRDRNQMTPRVRRAKHGTTLQGGVSCANSSLSVGKPAASRV